MSEQNQTNWKIIITTILAVLVIYILWDLYVQEDPLTRTAELADDTLDAAVDVVSEGAQYAGQGVRHTVGYVYDKSGNVVRVVYNTTKNLAGATVNAAGHVIDTTGNIIGVAVDKTGQVIRGVGTTASSFATGVGNTAGDLVRGVGNMTGSALVYAGSTLKSEDEHSILEGDMIKDLDGVKAAEEEVDSEVMAVDEDMSMAADEAVAQGNGAVMTRAESEAEVTTEKKW